MVSMATNYVVISEMYAFKMKTVSHLQVAFQIVKLSVLDKKTYVALKQYPPGFHRVYYPSSVNIKTIQKLGKFLH